MKHLRTNVGLLPILLLASCGLSPGNEAVIEAIMYKVMQVEPLSIAVDAGPDQIVVGGETVSLIGTIHTSRASDELVYEWAQTNGPVVEIDSVNSKSTSFVTHNWKRRVSLSFKLMAGVSESRMREDSVTIIVEPSIATE